MSETIIEAAQAAVQKAQSAVGYVRSEVTAAAMQVPDGDTPGWRGDAQRGYIARLDILRSTFGPIVQALDNAERELAIADQQLGAQSPTAEGSAAGVR